MKKKQSHRAPYIFLVVSVALHIALAGLMFMRRARPVQNLTQAVQVEYISPPETTQLRADKKKGQAAPALPVTRQVVEQKDQLNDELDQKTRFLSAHNQKVIQETKAARSGKFSNTAEGGRKEEGSKEGRKDSQLKAEAKSHQRPSPREAGEIPALRDLTPKFSVNPGYLAPESDKNGNPSQTDDYLKDVHTGLQTLLSTREFIYYSYYARIKEAIRQHWEPNVREKVKIIYRQGRTIAAAHDRVTQVLVTLNAQGELISVNVLTQSGVEALDAAAVEAFQQASPFPNPPKGMVESDGTIKIRWDFVLEA